MNELKIFEHPKFGKIRTIIEDGKTLFCGLDAANALGYAKPQDAINRHCRYPAKHGVWVQTGIRADGSPAMRETDMLFIPEGDLCRLAAKSELPGASEFESWIFDEVIPAILRTGTYTVPGAAPKLLYLPEGVSLNGLAKLLTITRRMMLDMGKGPNEIGSVAKGLFDSCGVPQRSTTSSPDRPVFSTIPLWRDKKRPAGWLQHPTGQARPKHTKNQPLPPL